MSDSEEMLERIYARGDKLRRRRRASGGLAATLAVAALAAGPIALVSGHEQEKVRVVNHGSSSTSVDPPTPTTIGVSPVSEDSDGSVPSSIDQPEAIDQSVASSEADPQSPSSTTVCRNSFDPSCGPFSWAADPPPSQPITFAATWLPDMPIAGQAVTFTIELADADATVSTECYEVKFGDGVSATNNADCSPPSDCPDAFGPHDPPPPKPSTVMLSFTHTYEVSGQYSLVVNAASGLDRCGTPYANWGTRAFSVTVGDESA